MLPIIFQKLFLLIGKHAVEPANEIALIAIPCTDKIIHIEFAIFAQSIKSNANIIVQVEIRALSLKAGRDMLQQLPVLFILHRHFIYRRKGRYAL